MQYIGKDLSFNMLRGLVNLLYDDIRIAFFHTMPDPLTTTMYTGQGEVSGSVNYPIGGFSLQNKIINVVGNTLTFTADNIPLIKAENVIGMMMYNASLVGERYGKIIMMETYPIALDFIDGNLEHKVNYLSIKTPYMYRGGLNIHGIKFFLTHNVRYDEIQLDVSFHSLAQGITETTYPMPSTSLYSFIPFQAPPNIEYDSQTQEAYLRSNDITMANPSPSTQMVCISFNYSGERVLLQFSELDPSMYGTSTFTLHFNYGFCQFNLIA